MTTLADLASVTDIDRVTRMVAEAANRMKTLESDAEGAFRTWLEAQDNAEAAGLVVDLKVGPGIAAALAEFKQRRSKAEAAEIVSEELGWSKRAEVAA